MKLVWDHGSVTVRDVYEELLKRRKVAYTTVLTMMKILETKQYIQRAGGERAFIYKPVSPKHAVIKSMVKEFVDRVFNGSAEPLPLHLVEDERLTQRDLEEIMATIAKGE